MKKVIRYLYFVFCNIIFKRYCTLRVEGKDNLPMSPFILCSNHNSHMDTPALMLATGISFNQFGMIAARDYFFDNPWRKIIVNTLMNLIPIDRKITRKSLTSNILNCQEFVKKGQHYLIMYPEGTRSLTGEIQPFKCGPAFIAKKLGIPLIPVYISGTYEAMAKGVCFPRQNKIYVKIGNPIFVNNNQKSTTQLLEQSIRKLKE